MDFSELKKKDRLTYAEAAAYCDCSIRTMKRWVNRGLIKAGRFTLGSVFILRESIDQLCRELVEKEAERGSQDGAVTGKDLRLLRA